MASPAEIERKVRQLDNDVQAIYELLATIGATQKRQGNRLNEIVAAQSDHGEKLDAILDLVRGNGGGQVIVPDLTGMTTNEAQQVLRGLGWTGNFNQQGGQTKDPAQFGKIIEQDVATNTNIDSGQDIGIIVATMIATGGES
jgi:hypothetical protein